MRAVVLALLVLAPALAGCGTKVAVGPPVVPYPRLGDAATYSVTGAYVEMARWENAHPFAVQPGKVRFELSPSEKVLDGARQVHNAFKVKTSIAEGGPFVEHAQLFVAPEHEALVQSYYKLSQDQGVVAFDERGLPWLFGASALFGRDLGSRVEFVLGRTDLVAAWVPDGMDGALAKMKLVGPAALEGELWMEPGVAWPARAHLALKDASLEPTIRADGAYPATLDARRIEWSRGTSEIPPRNSGARFVEDASSARVDWDGEKPPDGAPGYVPYLLADAVRDAKTLDRGLVTWLAGAADPRLYRATYKEDPAPVNGTPPIQGTRAPYWLLQFVSKDESYYGVEIERIEVTQLGQGAPRVLNSGPVDAPKNQAHGWFAKSDLPAQLVPLSEGVRVVKQLFGAKDVQIFLRSFDRPAGYAYYIDGGWDGGEKGRYTVVFDPQRAFVDEATGPVTPRLAVGT